jgi:serine/threonine protein kinase
MMNSEIVDVLPLEIQSGEFEFISRIQADNDKRIVCLYEEKSSQTVYQVKLDMPKSTVDKLLPQCRFLKSLKNMPPRFPNYISHGQQDGRRYLIIQNISKTFDEHIEQKKEEGIFYDTIIADLGVQMLDAIKQLHELGYIHRDITHLDFSLEGDKVYLTDFTHVKQYRDQSGFILSESTGLEFHEISVNTCSINAHIR